MTVLHKVTYKITIDPEIPLPGINTRELKTCPHKNLYLSVHNSIISNSPKAGKNPNNYHLINKIWHIHTMEYYSAINRNEEMIHATRWKNLENIMPSHRSQSQKTTYNIIPFI